MGVVIGLLSCRATVMAGLGPKGRWANLVLLSFRASVMAGLGPATRDFATPGTIYP
jgi:hypothetical protein